jgi:hypothetical protein
MGSGLGRSVKRISFCPHHHKYGNTSDTGTDVEGEDPFNATSDAPSNLLTT